MSTSIPNLSTGQVDRTVRGISRRTFLALSALVGADVAAGKSEVSRIEKTSPDEIALQLSDLADPDSYVEWSIEPETAPLPRYLMETVDGFVPETGAMTGFLATEGADGPDAVESAVYPGVGVRAIVAATDRWVRQQRGDQNAKSVRHEPGRGVVQWETVGDGTVDVLRLERLPRNMLAFVGVSGTVAGAGTTPRSAVGRYADVMRARAEGRPPE